MPETYAKYIMSWKDKHPNWIVRFWTDDDINNNFINLEYIQKAKKWAQKADIIRYEIIYKYGGLYIDTDFECFKNIEELIKNSTFFTCNGDHDCPFKYVIANSIFGASKKNIISKYLMDNIKNTTINVKPVNEETGPFYFGKILNNEFKKLFLEISPRLFFPHTYREYHDNVDISNYMKEAYAIHHWGNSWNGTDKNEIVLKKKGRYIIYTSEFPNNSYGGIATVTYNMYMSLKKYYNTYVIVNPYNKEKYFKIINNNVMMIFDNIKHVNDFINVNDNDVVICHNCEREYIYDNFSKFTKKCYMVSHGFYDIHTIDEIFNNIEINKEKESFIKDIYKTNANRLIHYNNIIAVNPEFAVLLKNKYPEKNIYYIPNCINTNNIYDNKIIIQNKYNNKITNNDVEIDYSIENLNNILRNLKPTVKFIYVGRVEEYKNIKTLINAFKLIKNATLTIIGSNFDNIDIKHENIIYINHLQNNLVIDCIKYHDVLVNISLTESFPMVLLEAGVNKLCCYISRLKGLYDIFDDNVIYATNHYDVTSTKNDIENIINNKNIIQEKGNMLYNHIMDNYIVEHYHQYLYQLQI